jgi:hypothetical protein
MNDLQRKAAEVQLGVLKLQHKLLESRLKGDKPGHPFRGNQYSGGSGGGGSSGNSGGQSLGKRAEQLTDAANQASSKLDKLVASGVDDFDVLEEAFGNAIQAHAQAADHYDDLIDSEAERTNNFRGDPHPEAQKRGEYHRAQQGKYEQQAREAEDRYMERFKSKD